MLLGKLVAWRGEREVCGEINYSRSFLKRKSLDFLFIFKLSIENGRADLAFQGDQFSPYRHSLGLKYQRHFDFPQQATLSIYNRRFLQSRETPVTAQGMFSESSPLLSGSFVVCCRSRTTTLGSQSRACRDTAGNKNPLSSPLQVWSRKARCLLRLV